MDWKPTFSCCYHCGSRNIHRLHPTAFKCGDCERHLFINPVCGVVGFLVNPAEELLMLRRAMNPAKGKLGLPGGFLDPGETGEQGLSREIREETGLEVGQFNYASSQPNRYLYEDVEYLLLDLFYWARIESFDDARALDEVDALVPVPLGEIDMEEVAFPSMVAALTDFRANFPKRPAD